MARMHFMNTEIDNITMEEALDSICELVEQDKNAYVVTPNVDHIVKLETDQELCQVYKNADLILTDGKPLVWISKWYKTPIKEKVSGSDLFPRLCERAAKEGYSMFFLGAAEGVAQKAADNLVQRFPGLKIARTYSPKMGFEKSEKEVQKVIDIVKQAKPHILVVALGCPKQEKFMFRYKNEMQVPISLGLGASVDFEAGNMKRAPKWMCDYGLEWLFRLVQEPKRMFKRYIVDDMKIFRLAIKYKKGK